MNTERSQTFHQRRSKLSDEQWEIIYNLAGGKSLHGNGCEATRLSLCRAESRLIDRGILQRTRSGLDLVVTPDEIRRAALGIDPDRNEGLTYILARRSPGRLRALRGRQAAPARILVWKF